MTRHTGNWMWTDACQMLDQAERLHRQFFHLGPADALRPSWEPPVDIYETADAYWIFVALPGVPADQVEVAIDRGRLVIVGARPLPDALKSAGVVRLEIPHGQLRRAVTLPSGRFELHRRAMVDGCLEVCLRKL